MMAVKKVTLTVYGTEQKGNEVEEVEQSYIVPVRTLRVRQYKGVAKALGNVMEKVKNNEEIMEVIKVQMTDLGAELEKEDQEISDVLKGLKERNTGNRMEALRYLLAELPDEIINLVSLVSDVEEEIIDELEAKEMLDLVNACIEVNDINELATAIKDFFTNLQSKFQKEAQEIQNENNLKQITKPKPTK